MTTELPTIGPSKYEYDIFFVPKKRDRTSHNEGAYRADKLPRTGRVTRKRNDVLSCIFIRTCSVVIDKKPPGLFIHIHQVPLRFRYN